MIDITPFTERLKDAFRVLCWKIDCGSRTGIYPNTYIGLTEKRVTEIYNVDSLSHYDNRLQLNTNNTFLKTKQ